MAEVKAAPKEVVKYIEIEKKEARPVRTNVWASVPVEEYVYVKIPKETLHGYTYPEIMVNHDRFDENHNSYVGDSKDEEGGSRTFRVPPILAGEIDRIKARFQIEELALLQPKQRTRALRQLAGNAGATRVAVGGGAGGSAMQEGIPGTALPA